MLLFLDSSDLLNEWQRSGGARAALLEPSTARQSQHCEQQQQQPAPPAAGPGGVVVDTSRWAVALREPHPALQLLLSVDVGATMQVRIKPWQVTGLSRFLVSSCLLISALRLLSSLAVAVTGTYIKRNAESLLHPKCAESGPQIPKRMH